MGKARQFRTQSNYAKACPVHPHEDYATKLLRVLRFSLRSERQRLCLTQATLARLMGMSRESYNYLEGGKLEITMRHVLKFCEVTHVSLFYLLEGVDKYGNHSGR